MTRFLPTLAVAAMLIAPFAAVAQVPGGATQAPNPSPASPSVSKPGTMAPAPAATPPMATPAATPAKPMPAKPMAKPMHMAAKPMARKMVPSRDPGGDAAVEKLNEQALAKAKGA